MFLKELISRNQEFVDYAIDMHQKGVFEPNVYLLDLDAIKSNAKILKQEAEKLNISLFQMTKQFGRNPLVAKTIASQGIDCAVCVEWREAEVLYKSGIKIGNIGHIVQVPVCKTESILKMKPVVWTVFSFEAAKEINDKALKLNMTQDIILKVYSNDSELYYSQLGGFCVDELDSAIKKIKKLSNVKIVGLTVFPALKFDDNLNKEVATKNILAMNQSLEILENNKINIKHINLPSANNAKSLELVAKLGGNYAEPGHAFTGTTPISDTSFNIEKPAILYLTEVSHNFKDLVIAFAGGHYRRGHQKSAVIGNQKHFFDYKPQSPEALSYYYDFHKNSSYAPKKGDPVIMCFRTQIFVTRSKVIVISGLSTNKPKIEGIFNSQGEKIGQ